jgi:3-oxoacyl-[acyl-carrier-protein] synthase II
MTKRRVVITGLGVVNSLGIGREAYFDALLEGKIGIDRINAFNPEKFPCQIAAEAAPFKVNQYIPKSYRKSNKLMSRDIALAVVAADQAIRDANLMTKGIEPDQPPGFDPTRSGVSIGAGLICCDLVELAGATEYAVENGSFSLKKWGTEGMAALTPLWLLKYLPNMLSCHISIIHDLQGPSNSVTCAEASGQLAIGEAYNMIAHDKADLMIAGGAESKVNPIVLLRQCFLKRTANNSNGNPKGACRPFDQNADGTVVGEGAGIVVLESLEHALNRGAPIYAEVKGFGASCNFSKDFVEPEADGTGIAIAMQKALAAASLAPKDIDLLIPSGTAVPSHDQAEAYALKSCFGEALSDIPVFTTKSQIGNTGAAAAAMDLITTVLAMHEQKIPVSQNSDNVPDSYGLNVNNQRVASAVMKNGATTCYTYGGQTAALVVSASEGAI